MPKSCNKLRSIKWPQKWPNNINNSNNNSEIHLHLLLPFLGMISGYFVIGPGEYIFEHNCALARRKKVNTDSHVHDHGEVRVALCVCVGFTCPRKAKLVC